ncbi:nuclear transport factor 2 family protein [Streptomyces sp. AC154]|uniref:nuclear transport factor 2 family protein n=1 Tax=Streptomyces sp. AC154 TaxID=3143184 RepID=UPI003F8053DE
MGGNDDEEERSVRAAVEGELRLLDPAVRALPDAVTELLDPEFTEFGASGRRYDRTSILGVTSADAEGTPVAATVTGMSGRLLAPGLVHLTFMTERDGRRVRRNSVWRRTESRWRLYFHQGTPVNASWAERNSLHRP